MFGREERSVAKVTTIIELKDGRTVTFEAEEPYLEFGFHTDTVQVSIGPYVELWPLPGRMFEVHYKTRPWDARTEIQVTMTESGGDGELH